MSYLSKLNLKKKSKIKLVFKGGKYEEFPDDIYITPAKQSYFLTWIGGLNRFSNLNENDLMIKDNILGIERAFYQLILLSACLETGANLGDAFDTKEIDTLSLISCEPAKELFMAATGMYPMIDKGMAEFFVNFVIGLDEVDFSMVAKPKTKRKRRTTRTK